jgi:hypothetical protein
MPITARNSPGLLFLQNLDRNTSTIRLTNFENSNADIFYFAFSFLSQRVKINKQLEDMAAA